MLKGKQELTSRSPVMDSPSPPKLIRQDRRTLQETVFLNSSFLSLLSASCPIVVRATLPRYSNTNTGEVSELTYAFSSSAGNAVTLIADFSSLPKVADSIRIDIAADWTPGELADEIERRSLRRGELLKRRPRLLH